LITRILLSQARLSSGDIAPLFDNRLLHLPWVGARPGADLLGDVNTLLSWLQKWHKLSDMLALPLWLKVASLLRHLLNDGLFLVKALLWAGGEDTSRWATELTGHLLTLGFRRVLLNSQFLRGTDLLGPFCTLLFSSVTLGDILTLLLLDGLTLDNIILNIVLMVPGLTLRLIDGLTFFWTLAFTDQRGVAKLDWLLRGNLFVFNKAAFDEVLFTLLLLLRLKVSSVSGVALLAVAVLALDDIIIFSFFNHDNLVNAPLSSSSNGSNVKSNLITTSLT